MTMWNYLVPLLSLFLVVFLVFKNLRRANRSQLLLRIIVSVIAVVSLTLAAFDPEYNSVRHRPDFSTAILVTEIPADKKDRILDSMLNEGIPAYTFDPGLATKGKPGIKYIQTVAEINSPVIHVFGVGPDEAAIEEISKTGNHHLIYHAPESPAGFENISWRTQINSGDNFTVQGRFKNAGKKDVTLVLEGFGTRLDSIVIEGGSSKIFSLKTYPKQQGRAVYSLLLVGDTKEVLQHEKIPFEVLATRPLKILVLSSAPDFENKFLKSWLFTNNYGIVLRNRISKGKYTRELLNITDVDPDRITNAILSNFDIIIADATELAAMPPVELNAIKNSVEQSGLGLIIKADSITSPSLFYNQPFTLVQAPQNNLRQYMLGSGNNENFPALTLERPFLITAGTRLRNIVTDKDEHVFVASTLLGSGKLVYSTVYNSYSWSLSGDSIAYRSFWTDLINESARRDITKTSFRVSPKLPHVNHAMTLNIQAGDSLPFRLNINAAPVAIQQDLLLPFKWDARFWPRKTGWQTVQREDAEPFHFYAFGKGDWEQLEANDRIAATKKFIGEQSHKSETKTAKGFQKTKIPKIFFIIIFLICCFYLWIEEKFHNSRF